MWYGFCVNIKKSTMNILEGEVFLWWFTNEHDIQASSRKLSSSLSGKGRKGLSGGRNNIRHGSMLCSGTV